METICPLCGSSNIYIDKKGYSVSQGAFGLLLTGNLLGLAGGLVGSNKIVCKCLECGNTFSPEEGHNAALEKSIIDNYKPGNYEPVTETEPITISEDELIEDLIKEALDSESNNQWDMAFCNWDLCLARLASSGRELDMKIAEKAIECARDHGNPFRLMGVYENLISKWPTHPDAQSWQESLNKLEENPFG
ncbi:MAG: hypothetical protein IJT46_02905 [Bacteroidaceae bacterium]|nr:hypothetical protein [Bacteroidaceae bacterium]